MQKSEFEFEVLVNGKPVAEYAHQGKTFIEGKETTEFSLRLRNRSSRRALFVPTIDGLSVMDGKEASLDSSGYIIGAYSTETITGWRTSDDDVAKFFFAKIEESYAAKTGKDGNVGVIGCAVFREKQREPERIVIREYIDRPVPYPVFPYHPRCPYGYHYCNGGLGCYHGSVLVNMQSGGSFGVSATGGSAIMHVTNTTGSSLNSQAQGASAAAQMKASMPTSALGTGFGEAKYEPVKTVQFEREKVAVSIFEIHYNTRQNLEAMGVEFKRALYASAQAFPKGGAYCEPPVGWPG